MKAIASAIFFMIFSMAYGLEEFPREIPTVNDLLQEVRSPFVTKLKQLKQNFITKGKEGTHTFTSDMMTICLHQEISPNTTLSRVVYQYSLEEGRLVEEIKYYGCLDKYLFKEIITWEGEVEDIVTNNGRVFSNISFELNDKVKRFHYSMKDSDGIVFFEVDSRGSVDDFTATFSLMRQKFMIWQKDIDSLVLQIYPISFDYRKKYFGISRNFSFEPFSFRVLNRNDSWIFLTPSRHIMSLNNFLQFFDQSIKNRAFEIVQKINKYHLFFFPSTEFSQRSGGATRLLNEMRITLTRLLNNTDMTLVKNFIRSLIEAIEKGLIIDNRPVEN